MLHAVGLLSAGNEALIPYAIRMIKQRHIDFGILADFKKTFSRHCKVHFVGVWDTVSSVGWIYDAVEFPYTARNPDIGIVRHAVSIDERRAFFRQNLFDPPSDQDVLQVWFAGVHSDVGGSYPESESQLSKISLRWMICEAEFAGLAVDLKRKNDIRGEIFVRCTRSSRDQFTSRFMGFGILPRYGRSGYERGSEMRAINGRARSDSISGAPGQFRIVHGCTGRWKRESTRWTAIGQRTSANYTRSFELSAIAAESRRTSNPVEPRTVCQHLTLGLGGIVRSIAATDTSAHSAVHREF